MWSRLAWGWRLPSSISLAPYVQDPGLDPEPVGGIERDKERGETPGRSRCPVAVSPPDGAGPPLVQGGRPAGT